ncbi:MAG: HAD-IC family P-type ATPase, partial [Dehalococcoidia bacterium]
MLWSATTALLVLALAGIGAGGFAHLLGSRPAGEGIFAATAAMALGVSAWSMVRDILRRTSGVDIIAVVAIAGALALEEFLAGAVIGLMLATGRALEDYASRRAEEELSSLLQRAPRTANRLRDGQVETVSVDSVEVGETILIREGDVVPVDGLLTESGAVLNESALTGESRPVTRQPGDHVRSGVTNAGPSFQVRCSATAEESTYAGIIRMVREAQASRAPFVRLADRYARYFVPLSFAVAAGAWAASGDAHRALAVLVVATPCPLLLAAPVAIISGVSRMARRGVVAKGGAALEVLARTKAIYLDKTGTITSGRPRLQQTIPFGSRERPASELLRLAASLNQVSSHVLAEALIAVARERSVALTL